MRIAEYKQIKTEVIETVAPILDEDGNETGETETIRKEIPIMGMVYRDMTEEEEAEAIRQQKEIEEQERKRPLSESERMDVLEDAFAELCEVVFNG